MYRFVCALVASLFWHSTGTLESLEQVAVLPLNFVVKVNCSGSNVTNCTTTNATGGCVWSSWSACSRRCGSGVQSRTQVCEDEDDDQETQELVQNRTCNTHSCDADVENVADVESPSIHYKGTHRLGEWFTVELTKVNLPSAILEAANVDVALVQQVSSAQAARRGLLEVDPCAEAFSGSINQAETNADNRWEVALKSAQAGSFTCCLRAPSGAVAAYGESVVVQGPTHVDISGVECSGTSSPIEINDLSAINVQVSGISLQASDAWGLVQASQTCPPPAAVTVNAVSGASQSRSSVQRVALPGEGPVSICYRYADTWVKLPTCAAVRATQTDVTTAVETPTDSANWTVIGSVLAVVSATSVALVWGLIMYRRRKASRMEAMFAVVSEDGDHEVGAYATPVKSPIPSSSLLATPLVHSNCSSRQGSALRSRYTSPMKAKSLTPVRAPAASPTRRSPTTFLHARPYPSPHNAQPATESLLADGEEPRSLSPMEADKWQ